MKNNVKTSVTTYIHATSNIHVKHIHAGTDDMVGFILYYCYFLNISVRLIVVLNE